MGEPGLAPSDAAGVGDAVAGAVECAIPTPRSGDLDVVGDAVWTDIGDELDRGDTGSGAGGSSDDDDGATPSASGDMGECSGVCAAPGDAGGNDDDACECDELDSDSGTGRIIGPCGDTSRRDELDACDDGEREPFPSLPLLPPLPPSPPLPPPTQRLLPRRTPVPAAPREDGLRALPSSTATSPATAVLVGITAVVRAAAAAAAAAASRAALSFSFCSFRIATCSHAVLGW